MSIFLQWNAITSLQRSSIENLLSFLSYDEFVDLWDPMRKLSLRALFILFL